MNVKENMSIKINIDNDQNNILITVNSPKNMNITVKTPFQTLHYVPLIQNPDNNTSDLLPIISENSSNTDDLTDNDNSDSKTIYYMSDDENEDESKNDFQSNKTTCTGCYPIYLCNQLAHMDIGGCLSEIDNLFETPVRKRKSMNSNPERKSKKNKNFEKKDLPSQLSFDFDS